MSIERQVRMSLWRLSAWRLVVTLIELPEALFRALATLVHVAETFFSKLSIVAFQMELDAARKYFALTGLDLAKANGDDDRYRAVRIAAGVEEEEEYDAEEDLE